MSIITDVIQPIDCDERGLGKECSATILVYLLPTERHLRSKKEHTIHSCAIFIEALGNALREAGRKKITQQHVRVHEYLTVSHYDIHEKYVSVPEKKPQNKNL